MNSAVEVKNVRMVFNLMEENVDTLKEYVMRLLKGKLFYNEFVSLDNISFTVEKGKCKHKTGRSFRNCRT